MLFCVVITSVVVTSVCAFINIVVASWIFFHNNDQYLDKSWKFKLGREPGLIGEEIRDLGVVGSNPSTGYLMNDLRIKLL